MIFAVKEKGKKKDYRTVLDKLFSPEPRRYRYTDLFAHIPNPEEEKLIATDPLIYAAKDSIVKVLSKINYDSIASKGGKSKVLHLKEVVVKAKKWSKEMDVIDDRTRSMAYYDVSAEQDKIQDEGGTPETSLIYFLRKINKDFHLSHGKGLADDTFIYKTLLPFFVIDHERLPLGKCEVLDYIRVNYVKSIYISEDFSTLLNYGLDPMQFSCVVFLEMFPDWKPVDETGKGVRKTWLDGYSQVKEFYSPNYSKLPPELDYRRTLYWNPSVKTDKDGKALIQFYNNSSCHNFTISAETITPQGVIGVMKK